MSADPPYNYNNQPSPLILAGAQAVRASSAFDVPEGAQRLWLEYTVQPAAIPVVIPGMPHLLAVYIIEGGNDVAPEGRGNFDVSTFTSIQLGMLWENASNVDDVPFNTLRCVVKLIWTYDTD